MSDPSDAVGVNSDGSFEDVLQRLQSLEKRVDRIDGSPGEFGQNMHSDILHVS